MDTVAGQPKIRCDPNVTVCWADSNMKYAASYGGKMRSCGYRGFGTSIVLPFASVVDADTRVEVPCPDSAHRIACNSRNPVINEAILGRKLRPFAEVGRRGIKPLDAAPVGADPDTALMVAAERQDA